MQEVRRNRCSRALIAPPESRIGPLDAAARAERIARSPLRGKYEQSVDRESAYEISESARRVGRVGCRAAAADAARGAESQKSVGRQDRRVRVRRPAKR